VLLPQSEIADQRLYERLTAAGAVITAITAYRTVMGTGGVDVPALLRDQQVNAITFTSPSTVENFLQRLTNAGGQREDLDGVCIACLGKTTARAAEAVDLQVNVLPEMQTIKSLVEAVEGYFEGL
jgi:uroporphyrinogen III methyltransferase/synthase